MEAVSKKLARREELQSSPTARGFFELFEHLPAAYFYAKDCHHRYIYVNRLVLKDVFGLESLDEIVRKTDLDFQPPALAEAYHAEDRRVIEEGVKVSDQVWLVPHVQGFPKWYVSTKTPLRDGDGMIVGIAGVMYPVETASEREVYFRELTPAASYIEANFRSDLAMGELADRVGLSRTQFNFRFRQLLRMSPSEYLLKLRVEISQKLLNTTEMTIAAIAIESGFYDQSHFTKRFKKMTGLTPRVYRKQFR